MLPAEVKKRRDKTPEQALAALMRLCARAEKSESDARRLMRGWGLAERDAEQVLGKLVRDRFIDDGRYAEAFVREKLRLSGWGAYKIRTALQRKGIRRELIDAALAQAVEICSGFLSFYLALPLLEMVLSLLQTMIGG